VSARTTSRLLSTLAWATVAGNLVACTATTDGKGGPDDDTASTTITNTAPTVSTPSLSPSTVYTNDTLSANVTTGDAEGDTLTVTYDWYVDSSSVQDGADNTLRGVSHFGKDQTVFVIVTADDGTDSTSMTSSTVTVSNTAPTAPAVTIDPSEPVAGEDLVCDVTTVSTDDDGDTVTYTMAWTVDTAAHGSALTTTWTDDTADGGDTAHGEVWECTATPNDGDDDGSTATDSVTIAGPRWIALGEGGDTNHSCGLTSDLEIHCWGRDNYLQTTNTPTTGVYEEVLSMGNHACALDTSGAIQCWGDDAYGQISSVPTGSGYLDISSDGHVCAIDSATGLDCWGLDNWGQVSSTPSSTGWTSISAGSYYTCGLQGTGPISCFGHDVYGWGVLSPPSGSFTQLHTAGFHGCAIDTSAAVQCWGLDTDGQATPPAGSFSKVALSWKYSCGLDTSGEIHCWGLDASGRVSGAPTGSGYTDITLGADHGCALSATGTIDCWGSGADGQTSPPAL
jgi:hypothetical protein